MRQGEANEMGIDKCDRERQMRQGDMNKTGRGKCDRET